MRVIRCDGSPSTVDKLDAALRDALDGGESVVPLGEREPSPEMDPGAGHVVVTTSGSTGQPKRVVLSAAALRASATATLARLGGPGGWLLALPAEHVAGLQVLVRAALGGSRPGVLDLRDRFDIAAFCAAAGELHGQRRYTALVPTQLARLLDDTARGRVALTGFDAVLLGGAAAPQGLLARAAEAGVRVVTTYGMSETAGGCVYDGVPLDGVEVRIDRGTGAIELSGPMLASGYLDAPRETAVAFRDGWFRTSDFGRLDDRGALQVLGRLDDVIVTGGLNVAPAEVEAVLVGLPGVGAACVVGLPDPDWGQRVAAAVQPADPAHPLDADELRTAARRRLSGAQTPKDIVLVDALPLRGIGKPDRGAVRALLTAGGD
ncbi:MAG TPA: o-succinylbenzoate--CoA ligase [Pseudonocardiaceae bacterium]|jgi:O-succinylbenzoic acid--CoA ligase